jgi:hypothetical protein
VSGLSLAQSKADIYDFLNLKLSEIHETYSTKVEMLANFMLQAQDEIRELKSVKIDTSLRQEDIRTLIEGRDKHINDQIQSNTHTIA